ncbi:MAG: N-acetyl-alpha-D-glucosaminyl L-malate synthase BshA [Flavobacteriaceae bacterium]|nr:N-acetyl-alpha-D-glucosaminyl L-malate synthase BshA [Flavobacteriaceae bacterium]
MRIGIVCYPTFGGSGVVATELGVELSKRGHNVHFLTYKKPVRLDTSLENIHFHEVHVPDYPLFHYQPYELALSSALVDMVRLHKIDLLHVHYAIPHAYAAYMAKQMLAEYQIEIPIVTTLHGSDITLVGSHPFYKPAVTFSINHSDIVTSVSKSLRSDTLDIFKIKKDIQVVPNFIDIDKYETLRTNCSRDQLAKPNERLVTHVSNFRPVKRVHDVLSVFTKLNKEVQSRLIMVGDGPERSSAEEYAKELGLTDVVDFVGKSNDVYRILCSSDLFLLPSQRESFGLAALEAMAARTPVIATNEGGIPEVVEHQISGYLSAHGDVDTMAANATELLTNEAQLQQFKEAAFTRAKVFDIQKIIPLYIDIYKKALL